MKKFTLVIYLLVVTVGIYAQKRSNFQSELQSRHKNYSEVYQRLKQVNQIVNWENSKPKLKSDGISQKLDSTVNQVYNELSSVWQKDYKDEFLYDVQMKNTSWLEKEWDGEMKLWDLFYRIDLGYDGNGRVIQMTMFDKDSLSHLMVVSGKINYYYNVDDLPDSVVTYLTVNAGVSFETMMKQINYYNESKQLIKTETWSYDEDAGAMVLGLKVDFTYTGTGKIKTAASSFMFEGGEFPGGETRYIYDSSDKLTSIENYTLNFFTFLLEKSSRDSYQYNANGDVSVQIYSTWNGTAWVDEFKDEFVYGTADLSEIAFPVFIALYGQDDGETQLKYSKAINVINSYEKVDATWKHTDINTFYYSGGSPTAINEIAGANFNYYPNPASETVTFSWKGNNDPLVLKLYQISGAQVMEQNAWPGKAVSLTNLVNGVYFFKLVSDRQIVYTGKLVKR